MFDQLVESQPHRERSTAQVLTSIVVHTAIITASIQLTRAVAATVARTPPETEMILARAPAPTLPPPATSSAPAISQKPALMPVVAPVAIAIDVAPVDLGRRFNPERIGQPGDPGGVPTGIRNELPADPRFIAALADVDDAVEYLDGPAPRYPAALRQVGIEGWVQLRYIVGRDGIAETGSIVVERSSNASFELPAMDAIRLAHFKPARIRGRAVRQVVEQLVRFALH